MRPDPRSATRSRLACESEPTARLPSVPWDTRPALIPSGPARGVHAAAVFPSVTRLSVALLCGRGGRLTIRCGGMGLLHVPSRGVPPGSRRRKCEHSLRTRRPIQSNSIRFKQKMCSPVTMWKHPADTRRGPGSGARNPASRCCGESDDAVFSASTQPPYSVLKMARSVQGEVPRGPALRRPGATPSLVDGMEAVWWC
jgi:hypothetical protein